MTSTLQVTISKAIADHYGIAPGTDIEWLPAGEAIRVVPPGNGRSAVGRDRRLRPSTPARSGSGSATKGRRGHSRRATAGGAGRTSTAGATLIDTNVLVYRFDPRSPDKQKIATDLLRAGIAAGSAYVAHQAIVEFVAAGTRRLGDGEPVLQPADARREADELLSQFDVLFPDQELVRISLRGAAAYQLACFDAHMWADAERFRLVEEKVLIG